MSEKHYRVINLNVANVMRVQAVDITPEPGNNLVVIGGNNGQGKSTTLNSMVFAIGGKDVLPPEPLRKGATKGHVSVDLGELKVMRTFTKEGGGTLTVYGADGTKMNGPQTILDTLKSTLTFDPLEFASKKPKEQAAILRALVGIDFTELDAKEKAAFDTRTLKGRDKTRLEGVFSGKKFHSDAPKELVSVAELNQQLTIENQKAAARDEANTQASRWAEQVKTHRTELARLEALIEAEKEKLSGAEIAYAAACEQYETLPEPDTEALLEQIANAESINQKVRENIEYKNAQSELAAVNKEVQDLTTEIDSIRARKTKMIEEAKFPIAGLGFGDEGVLFKDLPFEQAAASERLRVSVAIGAALNPKLKVLFVRDGSLLDDNGMLELAKIAEEYDCQVWVERVGKRDESAIIIEDGMVQE